MVVFTRGGGHFAPPEKMPEPAKYSGPPVFLEVDALPQVGNTLSGATGLIEAARNFGASELHLVDPNDGEAVFRFAPLFSNVESLPQRGNVLDDPRTLALIEAARDFGASGLSITGERRQKVSFTL